MSSRHIRGPLVYSTHKILLTGNYTIVNESLVIVNKTVGAATQITLPPSVTPGGRREVIVMDGLGDSATNAITVVPAGSDTINGLTSFVMAANFSMAEFIDLGAGKWVVVATGNNAPSEIVTTTNVIAASESGKTFYLNLAGGFTSTLPAPALGLNYEFVVKTAPTTAYIITTNSGADILYGMMEERAGTAGVAGAAQDTFNFVANQAIIADWVKFRSDGTNWYYYGMVNVAAGNTVGVT